MHVAHRGRAQVAPRPGMKFFEGVKILATYAAAYDEQGGEISGPGAEGLDLFQQPRMQGERLLEIPAERHGITVRAGSFAQIIVCR